MGRQQDLLDGLPDRHFIAHQKYTRHVRSGVHAGIRESLLQAFRFPACLQLGLTRAGGLRGFNLAAQGGGPGIARSQILVDLCRVGQVIRNHREDVT
jgi:hypothetical protein